MKKPAQGIEAIAVKRATLADNDKVRYRVYRAEDDFVAVIAESALMAMKVSGIMNPHRIVRDLPNEGIAIEAKRMSQVKTDEKIMMATQQTRVDGARLNTEMSTEPVPTLDSRFVAMEIKDLQKKTVSWARVLTPEMVEQAQAQRKAAEQPAPRPAPPPPKHVPHPDLVAEAGDMPIETVPEAPEPPPAPEPSGVFSEEEVQKLLNGG